MFRANQPVYTAKMEFEPTVSVHGCIFWSLLQLL